MKKGPSMYSQRDITKGRSTLSWQQQMWRKNSNGHTPGQDRNLGGTYITPKGGLVSKNMFRSWRVLVSGWLLEAKVIIVQNQTQTLKAGPLDLLTNTWIKLRLEKWKFHKQSQGLRGPAHGTCILLREAPGFKKSRNVCREIRQNTAGDASWNLLCLIHASLPDDWLPGGGWISQGSDVTGNK